MALSKCLQPHRDPFKVRHSPTLPRAPGSRGTGGALPQQLSASEKPRPSQARVRRPPLLLQQVLAAQEHDLPVRGHLPSRKVQLQFCAKGLGQEVGTVCVCVGVCVRVHIQQFNKLYTDEYKYQSKQTCMHVGVSWKRGVRHCCGTALHILGRRVRSTWRCLRDVDPRSCRVLHVGRNISDKNQWTCTPAASGVIQRQHRHCLAKDCKPKGAPPAPRHLLPFSSVRILCLHLSLSLSFSPSLYLSSLCTCMHACMPVCV